MSQCELAVVGIDSQFDQYNDIDRVARALYIGVEDSGSEDLNARNYDTSANHHMVQTPAIAFDISKTIDDSVIKMLQALNVGMLTVENIQLVIVAEDFSPAELALHFSSSRLNNITVVTQLADALSVVRQLVKENEIVALIGIETSSQAAAKQQTPAQVTTEVETDTANKISFDKAFINYKTSAGLASVLISTTEHAHNNELYVYADISCVASTLLPISDHNESSTKEMAKEKVQAKVKQTIAQALSGLSNHNNLHPSDMSQSHQQVELLEVSALADNELSNIEQNALIDSYQAKPLTTAISCSRSVTGEAYGFSQVLGLLRCVIAIQQRYIPGIRSWENPQETTLWENSSFYFPTESRPWLSKSQIKAQASMIKHAAYSCLTPKSYCHIILSDSSCYDQKNTKVNYSADITDIRPNGYIAAGELKLLIITAQSEGELQKELATLSQKLAQFKSTFQKTNNTKNLDCVSEDAINLKSMIDHHYNNYLQNAANDTKKYTLCLLADSIDTLSAEIALAETGIKNAKEWKTPRGSYYTALPVVNACSDQVNPVSFIYPGIGATYVGLGRDLLHLFPEIYPNVVSLTDDIAHSLKDKLLNPRSIGKPNFKQLKQLDLMLRGKLADIAEAGVSFACVFSQIFTKVFKINPGFAAGYSMGEVSMFAALGCWKNPGLMSERLANSATFNNKLSGDLTTLRQLWSLPVDRAPANIQGNELANSSTIWETYTIKATLAEVKLASVNEPRVFCTIINSPDSLLVAGCPEACLRVFSTLGVRAMPLNMANVIHSAPAKAEYDAMVKLYTMEVNPRIDTKIYSSSCYLPVPQLSVAIANSIAKCLCERVDFPKLVNTLYNNGARVFIEMGPGRSLCGWVDKTLDHQGSLSGHDKPRATVPVNAKGVNDETTYFRAIAKLISHGVKLDLHQLFHGTMVIKNNKREAWKT